MTELEQAGRWVVCVDVSDDEIHARVWGHDGAGFSREEADAVAQAVAVLGWTPRLVRWTESRRGIGDGQVFA